MKRNAKRMGLFIGIALLCLVIVAFLLGYVPLIALPIDSQVVDAETGKPIEGAVVVAYWELKPGSLTGDSLPCGAANVEETVTDKEGEFHIPGWGPRISACSGPMHEGDPLLFVFKSGYHYGRFNNFKYTVTTATTFMTSSAWKNRQMKLRAFHDIDYRDTSPSGIISDYDGINIDMGIFITDMPSQCSWKKVPNMLRALELERERISQATGHPFGGITAQFIYNNQYYEKVAPLCGSPKAFVEGLLR
jgi:hypothetical protein